MKITKGVLLLVFCLSYCNSFLKAQYDCSPDSLDSLFQQGEYEELIRVGFESLRDFQEGDTLQSDYAEILLTISRAYIQVDAFNEAFTTNQRALNVFLALNDSLGAAKTYSNFAGINFYLEDSAKAFSYLSKVKSFYPDSIPQAEKDRYAFMWALLYMQFGTPERAVAIIDSLLPELDPESYIYNYVLVSSIELMDSITLVNRYDSILPGVLSAEIVPDLKLAALFSVVEGAHRWQRKDIIEAVMPQLDSLMAIKPENLAVSHKTNYFLAKAWQSAYEEDFKAAYHFMQKHSQFLEKRDSIQGAEEVRKLEAQVRLKDAELNTKGLEKALQSSQERTLILIVIITLTLILTFVFYRLNKNTKEKNIAIAEVADTRERMLSILSHDMRSPLAQLKALLDAFEAEQISSEEMKALMPQLKGDTHKTLKMLDQTVAWINMNRKDYKKDIQSFKLQPLLEELKQILASQIQSKNLRIDLELDVKELSTDRFLLRTALFNLLNNAVKFSHEDGLIVIRTGKNHDALRIEVEDQGVGMSTERLKKLQNAISLSTTGTKGESGSGLGMSLIRDACKHMQASLELDSGLGKGTRCTLSFEA